MNKRYRKNKIPNKNMEKVYYYFKLFNSIKDESEVELAKLELKSLFGDVKEINNFADICNTYPIKIFTQPPFRVQDILLYEIPYGSVQGFFATKNNIIQISHLIRRLAYTREIYVIVKTKSTTKTLKKLFPEGVLEKNCQYFENNGYVFFRFITHQFFLEKSEYISKLSRNEKEIDSNVKTLFSYPFKCIYRIPPSVTLKIVIFF